MIFFLPRIVIQPYPIFGAFPGDGFGYPECPVYGSPYGNRNPIKHLLNTQIELAKLRSIYIVH